MALRIVERPLDVPVEVNEYLLYELQHAVREQMFSTFKCAEEHLPKYKGCKFIDEDNYSLRYDDGSRYNCHLKDGDILVTKIARADLRQLGKQNLRQETAHFKGTGL